MSATAPTGPGGQRLTAVLMIGAAVLLLMTQVLLIVREGEVAVVTTFGRVASAPLTRPGLHRRWPWPVQTVHRFDARAQVWEGALEQTLTRDGRPVMVSLYAIWRVAEPVKFLERVGTFERARRNLNGLLGHWRNAVIGRHAFEALVHPEPTELKLEAIESEIAAAAAPEALERYGIELTAVGVRSLGLPPAILERVYERMRAERAALAETYRAEGDAEAARLRAEAESRREQMLAEADADALRLRAEGDAAAADAYRVFEQDPELALFLRKLQAFEQTLGRRATVILGTETPPFDLFVTRPGAAAPASGK
ncbi:MAG: SPFH domain-containing protein [Kiritimatiellae bacterium]|nr:SPFH domain-containing protein [Kiritimatiellia bacterium]